MGCFSSMVSLSGSRSAAPGRRGKPLSKSMELSKSLPISTSSKRSGTKSPSMSRTFRCCCRGSFFGRKREEYLSPPIATPSRLERSSVRLPRRRSSCCVTSLKSCRSSSVRRALAVSSRTRRIRRSRSSALRLYEVSWGCVASHSYGLPAKIDAGAIHRRYILRIARWRGLRWRVVDPLSTPS